MSASQNGPCSREIEDSRVGYQAAINLIALYNETTWPMFQAMVVAHSIMVSGIVIAAASEKSLLPILGALPLAGLALCVLWGLQVRRVYGYTKYYILSAREFEHRLKGVETLTRGAKYSKGEAVKVDYELLPQLLPIRSEYISYAAIAVFALLYLFFLKLLPC